MKRFLLLFSAIVTLLAACNGNGPEYGPKGDGSKESPFNVAAANKAVEGLNWASHMDFQKKGPYFVKGRIASIVEAYGEQYGNAEFVMKDDGGSEEFVAYRVLYLGNRRWQEDDVQIKVGDEVVIYADLCSYQGVQPESVQYFGYLYSLNGVEVDGGIPGEARGAGAEFNPYNIAGAYGAIKAAGGTTSSNFYVMGKISSITYPFSADYGTALFTISDDGTLSGLQFTCYSVHYLKNQDWKTGDRQIAVGDDVVVCGKMTLYNGKVYETVEREGWLVSLNGYTGDIPSGGGSGGGSASGGGSGSSNMETGKVTATVAVIGLGSAYDSYASYVDGKTTKITWIHYLSSGKYYIYGGIYCSNPDANGGKGVLYECSRGYNSVRVDSDYTRNSYGTTIFYDINLRFTIP